MRSDGNRHREERGDAATRRSRMPQGARCSLGLLRFARNDDRGSTQMQLTLMRLAGAAETLDRNPAILMRGLFEKLKL
jgi:hypothetical protein